MSKFMYLVGMLGLMTTGCQAGTPEPAKTVERSVHFSGYGGLELQGTFLAPAGATKGPGVLLLPGSGPSDRNGNQLPLKIEILRSLAETLAANGIATLRFDKRAVAATYATSFPKTLPGLEDFFSWEAFVGDAEKALTCLRAQPEIDPARAAILGHSEGGLIALEVGKAAHPKALVLVSTAGRDLGEVIEEQIAQGYSAQFTDKAALQKRVAETHRVVAAIRETGKVPADVPAELGALFPRYLGRYLHSVFTVQPTADAALFAGSVLIVQGEKDIQISAERDAPKLRAGFTKTKPEFILLPNATHCLKQYAGPTDPGLVGPVLPEALAQIAAWLKKSL